MEALRKLTQEHIHILQGIKCLETARDFLEKNQEPPVNFFEIAVLFFTEYADNLHHYKEEYLLFSLLASKKGGKIDLEMGSLRYQHELNRRCIKKIKDSLKGYASGSEIAITTLLENFSAYISILKRHIYREDQLFFPMAEAELSDDEKQLLQAQFIEEEMTSGGQKSINENLSRLQEMEYLISGLQKAQ